MTIYNFEQVSIHDLMHIKFYVLVIVFSFRMEDFPAEPSSYFLLKWSEASFWTKHPPEVIPLSIGITRNPLRGVSPDHLTDIVCT